MIIPTAARRIILIGTILFLLVVAWASLAGGLGQLPRSQNIVQRVETTVQLACGLLSLLSAVTCFCWTRLRRAIRAAWIISLTTTAGLSSVAWGPPMLATGLAIAAAALLVALAVSWLLRIGGA